MKTHFTSLVILFFSGVLSVMAESLIVTNGETLELGGAYSYDNVLITNGTIYLTSNTTITSSGDISILSSGTITWHYTTTNWTTNTNPQAYNGSGGSGVSVYAQHGTNAWNLTMHSSSNLIINGIIDLRGGAGQTHVGATAQGYYGGSFSSEADRVNCTGGKGGSSHGGNGGNGAVLILFSSQGSIDLNNAYFNLTGGSGGNSGTAGYGGEGGSTTLYCPGGDGGDGGDTYGGTGGTGGSLMIRTKILNTDGWSCFLEGGSGGIAASTDYNRGTPGYGNGGSYERPMPNPGNTGEDGIEYAGILGNTGILDVIKQAAAKPWFENGQLQLGLDMTSTSATYIVESCTNLCTADWQEVGSFSGADGTTNWTAALSNRFDKAFYRIQTTY